MKDEPHVGIILLNWNNWRDTIECLKSLEESEYKNITVIIVDNNSKNDSIEKIRKFAGGDIQISSEYIKNKSNTQFDILEFTEKEAAEFSKESLPQTTGMNNIVLIKNDENYGFPGGNNIGMQFARKIDVKYHLLLNNDTVVKSDFVSKLVQVSEEKPEAGIVGSQILDYEGEDRIQGFGGKVYWWFGGITKIYCEAEESSNESYSDTLRYDHTESELTGIKEREYTWATSVLIADEVVENIGYLDTEFFFGIEEYDYCRRARDSGYKIFVTSESKVWHKKGGTWEFLKSDIETQDKIKQSKGMLNWKFYYKLFKKHLPPILFLIPFGIRMILTILNRIRKGKSLRRVVPGLK